MRATLSLTFVALGVSFSNTPHTGCNDVAPEVVQAVAAEMGYPPHQFKSCGDVAAAAGCEFLESNGASMNCCASCASIRGQPIRTTYSGKDDDDDDDDDDDEEPSSLDSLFKLNDDMV